MHEAMNLLGAILLLIQVLNGLILLVRRIKALKKEEAPLTRRPKR